MGGRRPGAEALEPETEAKASNKQGVSPGTCKVQFCFTRRSVRRYQRRPRAARRVGSGGGGGRLLGGQAAARPSERKWEGMTVRTAARRGVAAGQPRGRPGRWAPRGGGRPFWTRWGSVPSRTARWWERRPQGSGECLRSPRVGGRVCAICEAADDVRAEVADVTVSLRAESKRGYIMSQRSSRRKRDLLFMVFGPACKGSGASEGE